LTDPIKLTLLHTQSDIISVLWWLKPWAWKCV